ncbi:MAG: hypothetical protein KDB84_08725, partial [Flavobacteriales bacterium]|nr:hypothetical protein [Flavobacteriales bacterium]
HVELLHLVQDLGGIGLCGRALGGGVERYEVKGESEECDTGKPCAEMDEVHGAKVECWLRARVATVIVTPEARVRICVCGGLSGVSPMFKVIW